MIPPKRNPLARTPVSMRRNDPARLRGLYAITPDQPDTEQLIRQVRAVLDGGCRILQYRDKLADNKLRRHRAQALRELCHAAGALFLVNDHLALALAVDADGVHLGGEDGDLQQARTRLGPDRILGASCYADPVRAEAAIRSGADYIAFGAVFPSPTKPFARAAPLDLFGSPRPVPACAIGGISRANAPAVVAAGANMIAVITDLFAAPDITARANAFQHLFDEQ